MPLTGRDVFTNDYPYLCRVPQTIGFNVKTNLQLSKYNRAHQFTQGLKGNTLITELTKKTHYCQQQRSEDGTSTNEGEEVIEEFHGSLL